MWKEQQLSVKFFRNVFLYLLTEVRAKSKPVTCKFYISGTKLSIY